MLDNMKNTITLFFFLQVLGLATLSAQRVTGTVVDAKADTTLPAVNIKVLNNDNQIFREYVSDENGKFSVEVSSGKFVLQFSMIGYKQYSATIKKDAERDVELGNIALEEDSYALGEVAVVANSTVETIGMSIVYPNKNQLKTSDGGLSLLDNLHLDGLLVDVVNQTVTSKLASGIVYKINGVTSSLQQVNAIQPEQIQRVEYNSIATGRYASEDAAVINFVLKEDEVGTYIATNFTAAPTTGFINGMASFRSVYGKSQLSLDYNINWRSYTKPWGNSYTEYRYPTDTLIRYDEYDNAPFHYTYQDINLGYVYNDTRNIFSAKFILNNLKSRQRSHLDIYEDQLISKDIHRYSHVKDNQVTPSLDLFYKREFGKDKGLEVNLVGTLMNTNMEKQLSEAHLNEVGRIDEVFQNTDGRKKSLIFEGLYYDKRENFGFSTGVRAMYAHAKNTYIYDNVARLKQVDVYPYAEIEGKIKNLSYTISSGLKILHMDNFTNSKRYFRNLSTLTLFYKKNSIWNLRYNLRYTPQYPSLGSMSNIDQQESPIMIVRGNPGIKPAQNLYNRLLLTLNHKKLTINTSVFVQKTFDAIQSDIFYDAKVGSMVRHSDNHPYSASHGADLQIQLSSLMDIFTIVASGNWKGYKTEINGERYSYDQWQWYLSGNINYKDFTLSAGYHSPRKRMYGNTIILEENYSSISLMYKKGNLSLRAGVMYPFTSGTNYGSESLSKVAPGKSIRYIRDNRNMITIGFRYNINWGKSIFNVKQNIQNADRDRGILN